MLSWKIVITFNLVGHRAKWWPLLEMISKQLARVTCIRVIILFINNSIWLYINYWDLYCSTKTTNVPDRVTIIKDLHIYSLPHALWSVIRSDQIWNSWMNGLKFGVEYFQSALKWRAMIHWFPILPGTLNQVKQTLSDIRGEV